MSFGPLKNTSDYNNYVKKYLQTLQLQVALNQKNFNENVAYMKTGVQETERPDSRSIEERAGDVEKLKVQARAMLNKISDATNATEVLDYLVKNGDLLFFFIQQFPSIEEIVKKQFAGGIRAPLLISLIFKKFTTQQEESLLPESEDFNIVSNIMTREDVNVLIRESDNNQLKQDLQNVIATLPTRAEIKRVIDDPIKYNEELKLLAQTYKNSPTIEDYNRMVEQYNDAPLKNTPEDLDLETEEQALIQKVEAFLNETGQTIMSPTLLQPAKKTRARSSLARTIPKAPETRIEPTYKAKKGKLLGELESKSPRLQQVLEYETERAEREAKAAQIREDAAEAKRQEKLAKQREAAAIKKKAAKEAAEKAKKKGRPVGSKNIASSLPVAPTTPPVVQAPSSPPSKVASTGSGVLNQKEQDAHRFKVLKGEITAGNKSPELIKELKQLIIKLHRGGELSLEQTAGILKELNTL